MGQAYPPILFQSSDAGSAALNGFAGSLTDLLNECLIVKKVLLYTTTSFDIGLEDGSGVLLLEGGTDHLLEDQVLSDKTTQARTAATAASDDFNMLLSATPNALDYCYVAMQAKFGRIFFTLGTNGVGGTYVVEYYNGSSWSTLTVTTDTTLGLTQSGFMSWTLPTDWATTAVNGTTAYWVRIHASVAPSTSPAITTLSVTGWSHAYTGTNKYIYRQGGGSRFYMRVRDNAAHATALGREAQVRWFETVGDIDAATNTGPMPTAAQSALTDNSLIIRKSSAVSGTAITWALIADDRTYHMVMVTNDSGAAAYLNSGGDFYSFVNGDPYRVYMIHCATENSGAQAQQPGTNASAPNSTVGGHFIQRFYTGTGGACTAGKIGAGCGLLQVTSTIGGSVFIPFPNPCDGGLYVAPIYLNDFVSSTIYSIRGRLRGWLQWMHNITFIQERETFTGTGENAGRQFMRAGNVLSSGSTNCALIWDISPETPWESN